jgi:hypothetical protein
MKDAKFTNQYDQSIFDDHRGKIAGALNDFLGLRLKWSIIRSQKISIYDIEEIRRIHHDMVNVYRFHVSLGQFLLDLSEITHRHILEDPEVLDHFDLPQIQAIIFPSFGHQVFN